MTTGKTGFPPQNGYISPSSTVPMPPQGITMRTVIPFLLNDTSAFRGTDAPSILIDSTVTLEGSTGRLNTT